MDDVEAKQEEYYPLPEGEEGTLKTCVALKALVAGVLVVPVLLFPDISSGQSVSVKVLEEMGAGLAGQQMVASNFALQFASNRGVVWCSTNVVLSQGGQALKGGTRYAMVTKGNELKDPQTGQLLGRVESPCCELLVERVSSNLSYVLLENLRFNLDQLPVGGLQLREDLRNASKAVQETAATAAVPALAPAPAAMTKPARAVAPVPAAAPAAPSRDECNW